MAERDGFQPRYEAHEGLGRVRAAALILREADDLLRVQLTVTPSGMPRRWRRPPAVRLGYGEWLRWQVNYRFAGTCNGEWTYRMETLNVAHGPASVGIFLGIPTHHVKELASLR